MAPRDALVAETTIAVGVAAHDHAVRGQRDRRPASKPAITRSSRTRRRGLARARGRRRRARCARPRRARSRSGRGRRGRSDRRRRCRGPGPRSAGRRAGRRRWRPHVRAAAPDPLDAPAGLSSTTRICAAPRVPACRRAAGWTPGTARSIPWVTSAALGSPDTAFMCEVHGRFTHAVGGARHARSPARPALGIHTVIWHQWGMLGGQALEAELEQFCGRWHYGISELGGQITGHDAPAGGRPRPTSGSSSESRRRAADRAPPAPAARACPPGRGTRSAHHGAAAPLRRPALELRPSRGQALRRQAPLGRRGQELLRRRPIAPGGGAQPRGRRQAPGR